MHKVIKISGKILLAAILFVLFFPLVLSLLLAVPSVQNFVVDRAAKIVSRHLETTVSIDRIRVGFAGRIRVEGLYVEDYERDTLLYAQRLDAFLPHLGLTGLGLRFTSGELDGAKLFLRETASGEMNVRQLVARLSNPDKPKKGLFRLSLDDVAINDLELRIERRVHRNPAYGIDFGDMRFRVEHARLASLSFDGPTIAAAIDRLSLTERSGFEVRDLSGDLYVLNGTIGFDGLRLQLPNSDLSIPTLVLAGNSWDDFKDFVREVDLTLDIDGGSLSTDDAAYFAPALQHWRMRLSNIGLDLAGSVSSFETNVRRLTVDDGTTLRARGRVSGLPEWRTTQIDLRIAQLHTDSREALRLASAIGRLHLPAATQRMLLRTGRIDLTGRFEGTPSHFDAQLGLATALGAADATVRLIPERLRAARLTAAQNTAAQNTAAQNTTAQIGTFQSGISQNSMARNGAARDAATQGSATQGARLAAAQSLSAQNGRPAARRTPASASHLTATLTSRSFRLGALLDREPLVGDLTVDARLTGAVGHGRSDLRLQCDLTQIGFNDYLYDTVRFDGFLRNRSFNGRIFVRDPNLRSQLTGMLDWRDSIPRYDVTVKLDRADLHRLHINRRDTLSQLSARIVAKASGRSLDDLNGTIRMTNADYRYNDRAIHADNILVEGENSADRKYIALRSDFADVTFRSRTGYTEIFDYLRRSAWRYLPLTDRSKWIPAELPARSSAVNDFSLLDVRLHRIAPIADAVSNGLQIADGSSLKFMFNPASDQLSLSVSSDFVERRNLLATRLKITASNRSDSLTFYGAAEDLYAGLFHLPDFSLSGGARMGRVQLAAGFTDTVRRSSARLGLRAEVASEGPGGRVIDLHLLPSYVTSRATTWQLGARAIRIDSASVRIDRFLMRNEEQRLSLDGVLSADPADSVRLQLDDFELAPLLRFAEELGYDIGGRTNGRATMRAALGDGLMTADVRIDSLSANGLTAPPLRLVSGWEVARNRIGAAVTDERTRDTLARGFYIPATKRYYAALALDSLCMRLLDPMLEGVISDTEGTARVDLVLRGEGAEADLSGTVRVRDFATTVDYTQVRYTMPEATIEVADSRFTARRVPVFDPEENWGAFDLTLDLQHLSDIAYDVRLRPEAMLVLQTDADDNELFYGRLYATGDARIRGRKGETDMRITATTEDDSFFFMPLTDRSNLSNAEFVTFVRPPDPDSLDLVAQKRRQFERRKREKVRSSNRLKIDLALNVQPNVEAEIMVSGSPIRARGEGLLNLVIDPRGEGFEMFGDYRITEGSYNFSLQNLISKKFVIQSGSMIQWTGAPTDARLDIEAVYRLKTSLQPLLDGAGGAVSTDRSVPVECVIRIGDRLTNPTITFDVTVPDSDPETQAIISTVLGTPESVDMQFLYLLLFNSFMAENSTSSSNSNLGASASAATGLEFLSSQLSRLLSADDYNLVIRYRPKTEVASDELDFGLSRSLIDNRLYVEVEGNYLMDNKQAVNSSMSNFMGEAYVTYLIDRSGSLKLKAFTQTIDRFDENQGLQETGIGIYYKEDFDNLRDLFKRVKERFKRKEGKAKRNRKREARPKGGARQ